MSHTLTPGDAGQNPSTHSNTTEPDILEFLESFQRYLETSLPKVRAACAQLDARIRAEREAEEGDGRARDSDDEPRPVSIAFLSDGRTALHVSHLGGAAIKGRETWTGVVLHVAEACDVLDRLSDAAEDAAGNVAGYILYGSKKDEDDDGGAAQP